MHAACMCNPPTHPAPEPPAPCKTQTTSHAPNAHTTPQIVTLKRSGTQYALYQCGTPDPSALPSGAAEGVTPGMPSFEIPLYSVAVADTTVNGFLVGASAGLLLLLLLVLHARLEELGLWSVEAFK